MEDYLYSDLYNSPWAAQYGIKGMKWGVRRYQRSDGSLTSSGRTRQAKQKRGDSLVGRMVSRHKSLSKKKKAIRAQVKKEADAKKLAEYKAKQQKKLGLPSSEKSSGNHSLSDDELRTRINRIKLEQEYARLTAPPPKAKNWVKEAAKQGMSDLIKKGTVQVGTVMINKMLQQQSAATGKKTNGSNQSSGATDKSSKTNSSSSSNSGSTPSSGSSFTRNGKYYHYNENGVYDVYDISSPSLPYRKKKRR